MWIVAALAALTATAMAEEITLNVVGTCPGPVELLISGATPRTELRLIRADQDGAWAVPAGPCDGTVLDLSGNITVLATLRASVLGNERRNTVLSAAQCGKRIQVVDLTTCETTSARTLSGPRTRIASFPISAGPPWRDAPPVQTCVEVCAHLFGGWPSWWACSTRQDGADLGRAFVDGWGDSDSCIGPASGVSDSYSKGPRYDCDYSGGCYSAWVDDHDDCDSAVNHCWR